jgi:DNA-binding MarR family transcriptional regulator
LSRAIAQLEKQGLIAREHVPGAGRNQPLRLSDTGRALFETTLPAFERFETMMLDALTPAERATLADLLAKVVLAADDWPETLTDPARDLPQPTTREAR